MLYYPLSMKKLAILFLVMSILSACASSGKNSDLNAEAEKFLASFERQYQPLSYASQLAQWDANVNISEENDRKRVEAEKALADFLGSPDNLKTTAKFLEDEKELKDKERWQLLKLMYNAARRPGTIPEVVDALIVAEAKQSSDLYGFVFKANIKGKEVPLTANDIVSKLIESNDLEERTAVWTASKEVGKKIKDGLENVRDLRNQVAREMKYTSFFDLEVSDYGMSTKEMMALMEKLYADILPLYRELHTFARYELAKRYNQSVPDELPATWVPNRWGQEWPGIVKSVDMNELFKGKDEKWIIKTAENFYVSLGFAPLNPGFWQRSDLYPVGKGEKRQKNTHASAWHLDLADDYRSLMSVEPDWDWFLTTHHELGHIYYFIEYTRPDIPLLLRDGANRGFHEAIGTLISLAAGQQPYLQEIGLLPPEKNIDDIQWLLNEAMDYVIFIPFSAGTMTHFEHDLYEENLPKEKFNERWWQLVKKYQGIVPPGPRGEEYADAATKTHINDDPAQYYDYAISSATLFQLHNHIAKNILKQSPNKCNYYKSKEVGKFLQAILQKGAAVDWRQLMKETTGEDINAKAMLTYFAPLMDYLKEVNQGRKYTI